MMESGKWITRIVLCSLWAVASLANATEPPSLEEIVQNNELPKRVALTKAVNLSLTETSSSGSLTIPAGVSVEVLGAEKGKLKIRFTSATGLVSPEETDLVERVQLVRQKSIPETTANSTPVTAPPTPTSDESTKLSGPAPSSFHRKRRTHYHFKEPEPGSPLAKIQPPTDPNDAKAWRNYIDDIIRILQNDDDQNFNSSDPAVGLLAKAGPAHIDLLANALSKARHPVDFALTCAINATVQKENQEVILKFLPVTPNLIQSVLEIGCQADAKPVIVQELRKDRSDLPQEWVVMAAQYEDTDSNEAVRRYVSKMFFPGYTMKALVEQTSLDISDIAVRRYKEMRRSHDSFSVYELSSLAQVVALCGEVDGLKTLCDVFMGRVKVDRAFSSDSSNYYKQEARKMVMKLSDARGSDEEIDKWIRENFTKLTFNREVKRYVLP